MKTRHYRNQLSIITKMFQLSKERRQYHRLYKDVLSNQLSTIMMHLIVTFLNIYKLRKFVKEKRSTTK